MFMEQRTLIWIVCDPIVLDTKYEFIKVLYVPILWQGRDRREKNVLLSNSMTNPPLQSQKVSHSLTFLTKNFVRLSRNSSNTSLTKKRQKEGLLLSSYTPWQTPCCQKRSLLAKPNLAIVYICKSKIDFLNNSIICEFSARSTSFAERETKKKRVVLLA